MRLSRRSAPTAPHPLRPRAAFTLIELLVVISIIAILTALLAAATFSALGRGYEVRNRNDISQLQNAVASFCDEYQVNYVPSRIRLCKSPGLYGNSPLDQDSVYYLRSLWPRLNLTASGPLINWDGDPNPGNNPDVTLEGQECLVFFLGGIPNPTGLGCTGFGINPTDPSIPGGERKRYFEFKSERLRPTKGRYMVYLDVYGKVPYAFYSAYRQSNGYNPYGVNDCGSIGANPYNYPPVGNGPVNYYKPESFQILSAGADATFGPGGAWLPITATQIAPAGRDDMTNFYDKRMGIIGK